MGSLHRILAHLGWNACQCSWWVWITNKSFGSLNSWWTFPVIIIYAEKCPSPAPKQWWQKKPVYEVFVKSFKDSNGDGVGDLKGVESKLDYLSHLGVGSIYLSPVFKSPDKDNGFDVSDYKAIDPRYGTLEDFKALLAAIHEKGMKLIIDFIPNQTSDQHEWFQKSIANEEPYNDYYVWVSFSIIWWHQIVISIIFVNNYQPNYRLMEKAEAHQATGKLFLTRPNQLGRRILNEVNITFTNFLPSNLIWTCAILKSLKN